MKISLLDPESFVGGHPHDQYDWLRENAPAYFHEEVNGPGYWAITRYADVYDIGRNSELFSSQPTMVIPDPQGNLPGATSDDKMMMVMDPPEHTAFRKLISREFTQGPVRNYHNRVSDLARQIVDRVIDRGECEFISEIAGEMPSYVIADLVGLPLEDGRELYKLTEIIHSDPESLPPNAGREAVTQMFEYGSRVMLEKRSNPGDDLASKLLAAEVDGRKLTDMEFLLFFLLLIDAGGDTTRNLVGTGMYELMKHPDQLALLRSDIDRYLPTARDELLRWTTPVVYMRRTATRDTVLADQTIKAGDKVVMYYGAANRDPSVFDRPDELDITRTNNKHIAFGGGHHVCLGQWFARLEIDAILREVLMRMDDLELDRDVSWMPSNFICGVTSMPIRFKAV